MRGRRRLTARDFDGLRPFLSRMKKRNIDAVREILVDGRTQTAIAKELGISDKAVSRLVRRVWALHVEHAATPDGWESLNVTLPADLAAVVRDMERTAWLKRKGDG